MPTLHHRKSDWRPDLSPTIHECECYEKTHSSLDEQCNMNHLRIWLKVRFWCRKSGVGPGMLHFCLTRSLEDSPRGSHPACSFLSMSGLWADTAPGHLCLCLDLIKDRLWLFSLCLLKVLSPFGSQLQAPWPLMCVVLTVLIGFCTRCGMNFPFRFQDVPLPWVE